MRQFMDEHRVDHPLGALTETIRHSNLLRRRRTRRPPRLLVLHPAHGARRDAVVADAGETPRSVFQGCAAGRVLRALRYESLDEVVHESRAFTALDARRNQHDDPTTRPVGGAGLLSPGGSTNLDFGSIESWRFDR